MSFKRHSHELNLPLHLELFVRLIHQAHSWHRALVFHSFSHFWLLPCFYCNIAVTQGEERCFILDSSLAKATHILLSFPESALFFFPKLPESLLISWLVDGSFPKSPTAASYTPPHPPSSPLTIFYDPSVLFASLHPPICMEDQSDLAFCIHPFREPLFFCGVFGGWFSWSELTRVCAVSFWGAEEEAVTPSLEGISAQIVISDKPQRV